MSRRTPRLFVRQLQERVVQVVHVVVRVLVTHLFHAMFHGGTARAGGQVSAFVSGRQTDGPPGRHVIHSFRGS